MYVTRQLFASTPSVAYFWIIGAIYCTYLVARALLIPITVDEGYSIMTYVPMNVREILTYDYDGVSANNHILNTLSIKFLSAVLGSNLWAARLGNLMCGLLYVLAGTWLTRHFLKDFASQACFFLFWLGNPYMSEFFGIGRGYGMSIGLMMGAVVLGVRFFEGKAMQDLVRCLVLAWLGVLANFTLLNFYLFLSLALLWGVVFDKNGRWAFLKKMAISHILLALTLLQPLRQLSKANEYAKFGNSDFYQDTVRTFMRNWLMGNEFLGSNTYLYFAYGIAGLMALSVVLLGFHIARNKYRMTSKAFLLSLLPGVLLVNAGITLATEATWLVGRTNTFFYPLLVCGLLGCLSFLNAKALIIRRFFLVGLALMIVFHLNNKSNLRESFEWWFDRDTFRVLDFMKNLHEEEKRDKKITFNCVGILNPSFTFHLNESNSKYNRYIEPKLNWIEAPKPEDDYEFFYCGPERMRELADSYELVWVVQTGQRYLLRKKAK